jgi:hypothetical protein
MADTGNELDGKTRLIGRLPAVTRRTVRVMEGTALNNALNFSSLRGRPGPDRTIAWEMQPSLQHLVVRSESGQHDAPTWAETTPVPFDAFDEPSAFSEPLEGLSMRDIHEPEIFRAFFGDGSAAARA